MKIKMVTEGSSSLFKSDNSEENSSSEHSTTTVPLTVNHC